MQSQCISNALFVHPLHIRSASLLGSAVHVLPPVVHMPFHPNFGLKGLTCSVKPICPIPGLQCLSPAHTWVPDFGAMYMWHA